MKKYNIELIFFIMILLVGLISMLILSLNNNIIPLDNCSVEEFNDSTMKDQIISLNLRLERERLELQDTQNDLEDTNKEIIELRDIIQEMNNTIYRLEDRIDDYHDADPIPQLPEIVRPPMWENP